MKHPRLNDNWSIRYKFGRSKSVVPPELPAAPPEVSQMSMQAMRVGEGERKRSIGKTGRLSTRFTTPGFMTPAPVEKRRLLTKFGGS